MKMQLKPYAKMLLKIHANMNKMHKDVIQIGNKSHLQIQYETMSNKFKMRHVS